MTERIVCPPTSPEHELRKLILRMSHRPDGVVALHKNEEEKQTLDYLENGLKAESMCVVRVNLSEVFAKFGLSHHLFGLFLYSKVEMSDLQENTAFLFYGADSFTNDRYAANSLHQSLDQFAGRDLTVEEYVLKSHLVYPIVLLSEQSRKRMIDSNTFGNIREATICDFTGL